MQITKKKLVQKKGKVGETIHMEGKHVCNCLTRNYRRWLGKKAGKHLDQSTQEEGRGMREWISVKHEIPQMN